jgi:hypothetical protein
LTPEQFKRTRLEILGNQGAIAAGFDAQVDITAHETDFLQRKLIWENVAEGLGRPAKAPLRSRPP